MTKNTISLLKGKILNIEQVSEFKYLGSIIKENDLYVKEFTEGKSRENLHAKNTILQTKISMEKKIEVVKNMVNSTLINSTET